jgi:regulator of sigma E protease
MNILLGFAVMMIIVITSKHYASTEIDVFVKPEGAETYPTEYGELRSGDKILKINGNKVHIADEVSYRIFSEGAEPVSFTILRDGKKTVIENVQFPKGESNGISYGMRNFYFKTEPKNIGNTFKHTFYGSINSMVQIFDSLKGMLVGKYGIEEVSGPIGVGEALGDAAKMGMKSLLTLTVLLAMNLGIFNLLPIPALDGGRLVFLIIEAIRGKPVPREIEANIHAVGMMLLFGLIFVVGFKDIFMVLK